MTAWVYIKDIGKYVGEEVLIKGWIYNKRDSGRIKFLMVRDGTGMVQSTIWSKNPEFPLFQTFNQLTQESSVKVTGKIKEDKRAPGGFPLNTPSALNPTAPPF